MSQTQKKKESSKKQLLSRQTLDNQEIVNQVSSLISNLDSSQQNQIMNQLVQNNKGKEAETKRNEDKSASLKRDFNSTDALIMQLSNPEFNLASNPKSSLLEEGSPEDKG